MMPARRVLFLAWAPFFSGAERALILTLKSLDPTRYEPFVIAGTDGEFAAQVRALGISCEIAPLHALDRRHPIAGVRSVFSVVRTARKIRPAVIHANDAPSFQPGGYAARILGIPAITYIRFPDSNAGYRWFLRPEFALALFVSNDLMTQGLATAPELFTGRAAVLHDWVEPQPAWSPAERTHARRQLEIPDDAVAVAMTGQIAEVKGIWDFVEAARLVAGSSPEALFVVLGDDLKTNGAMREAMEQKVAALGLSGRFRFLGFRKDAPSLVQAFDIIAVPSLIEPLGNATLEAMAAGRPVVGSRVGGIPEMVVDGETGTLVPPRSPHELAQAFTRLVADPAERSRMSVNARRRSHDVFGAERHAAALQDRYDSLCGHPNVSPELAGRPA